MINPGDVAQLIGATAYSADGEKVGKIGQVFFDDRRREPAWASVSTGLFGMRESLVPLDGADLDGSDVHLTFSKDRIKDAPNVEREGDRILEADERELYAFYDLDYGPEPYAYGTTADEGHSGFGSGGSWNASAEEAALQDYDSAADADLGPATGESRAGVAEDHDPAMTGPDAGVAEAYDPAATGSGAGIGGYDPGTAGSSAGDEATRPDAETVQRVERVADAAEQRFRVRLRKYLSDPSIASLPVAEQAEVEDQAVAEEGVQDTTSNRPM